MAVMSSTATTARMMGVELVDAACRERRKCPELGGTTIPPKQNQHPGLSWGIKATKSLQHPARIQAGKRPWEDSDRTVLPITNLLAPRVQAGDGPMPSAVTAPGQCHCHLPAGWG